MPNIENMPRPEIILVADTVAREKNIDKEDVFVAMEVAIQKAARSRYGFEHDIRAQIDRKTGAITLERYREVVDEVENEVTQLTVEDAQAYKKGAVAGDFIIDTLPPIDFGRVAAQTAKQVIVQKVRDAERNRQYEEYKEKMGTIVNGTVKRIEFGIDVIDTATSCFSGGTSQPSTETMFYACQQYGIETGLDEKLLNEVNDYFKPIKQKYIDNGQINPKSLGTDAQALVYKVPGGMLSNMIANLTDMKAMDKFDAALAEIPQVRADMGYPPLVTPLSQMVGNQAVTNVLVGERYRQISKEIQNYIKGEYGIAPAPVSEALQKKVLGEGGKPVDCRIEDQKRTGQEFEDAKKALGDLARSEEDIMSYICYPDQTVKFLENRKAQEENEAVYTIEAM